MLVIKSFSVLAYGTNLIVGVLSLCCGQISKTDKTENIKVVLFQNRLEVLIIQLYKKKLLCTNQSHYREVAHCSALGDFYEKYLRFGLVGNTEKYFWANYEQLLRAVFSCFQGQKNEFLKINIVASALHCKCLQANNR